MGDIYGSHFEYAGVSSREYGLIIATVESDKMIQLSGEITGSTIYNRASNKQFLVGNDMSESPLSFEVEFVTDDNSIMLQQRRKAIEKWLFNRHNYRKLYFDIADDCYGEMSEFDGSTRKRLYLNCRFVNPSKLEYNGGIVGYRATLEADSGFFWQDPTTRFFRLGHVSVESQSDIVIDVDSDWDEYIYPKVSFTMGGDGGDLILINNSDDSTRFTKFSGVMGLATVTMRGEVNYVSGDYYNKFSVRNFPRLLDGNNNFTVHGNVSTITFEFQNRRNLS